VLVVDVELATAGRGHLIGAHLWVESVRRMF
jgi:hypothetical protein